MSSTVCIASPTNLSATSPTSLSTRGALRSSPSSASLCKAGLAILRRESSVGEHDVGKQPENGETAGPSQPRSASKRTNNSGSLMISPIGTQKSFVARPISRSETRAAGGLTKKDVEDVLSHISSAEKANFEKQWFLHDCRRRFQQLCSGDAQSFKIDEMDAPGFLQMFPTLSLDLTLQDRRIPSTNGAAATMNLVALFDADGDGWIDEQEFRELMQFCHAWRSTFYGPDSSSSSSRPASSPSVGITNRPPPNPTTKVLRSGSSAKTSPAKLPEEHRRTSGFGPRQFNATGGYQPSRAVRLPVREKSGSRQSSVGSRRSGSRRSSVSDRDSSSSETFNKKLEVPLELDGSRGAFYSSSVDLKRATLLNAEFLEFLEERSKSGIGTIEERMGHPLRSYIVPTKKFAGDMVR